MKTLPKVFIPFIALLFLGLAGALESIRHVIATDLNKWCQTAQAEHPYPGDNVAALLAYVQSDSHTLKERNHAIWALGQSRDTRALPVLKRYYTGEACIHEQDLCQYELKKALELCRGDAPNPLGMIQTHHNDD